MDPFLAAYFAGMAGVYAGLLVVWVVVVARTLPTVFLGGRVDG